MFARPYPAQRCGMRTSAAQVTTRTANSRGRTAPWRALAGRIAERAFGELDVQRLGLAVAVDLDLDRVAGLEAGDRVGEVIRVRDDPPTDLGHHVAAAQERRALEDLAARAAAQPRL